MTAPGSESKRGDRHPELGESWSWEGPRLELGSHRAGSHLLLQRRVGMLMPTPPALQPPSRASTGGTSRKPEMQSAAFCFLGHRAGWRMDQGTKISHPSTLPGVFSTTE